MKKMINQANRFVDETIEGIALAYPDQIRVSEKSGRILLGVRRGDKRKVGIATCGGSGHLPTFLGYVGSGMLDGCAIGNVFASPSASVIADTIREVDRGAGVLCLYGNYGGDKMNFALACEEVEFDDIQTQTVLVADDVASAPPEAAEKRRGVAGMVFAFKIAGAAADEGMDLDGVAGMARKALANTRTMGVALSACIVPEVGKPTFQIAEDELEVGMGIHGEPGIEVRKMMAADEIADLLLGKILEDMPLSGGDEVSALVNGLGSTPLEEQFIVYRRVHQRLAEQGIRVYMPHIGEYATSMEMAGLSLTVMKLDDELKRLLRAPATTPFYTNANK